ncbi:MAG: hypothetical protein MPJ02_03535 [Nitrosopumilus sp.]|nr:hypothetical protein [Nitrosopumilus sp.]MDA7998491.1 hypothetical protein [Nitrosopumilus sp.]
METHPRDMPVSKTFDVPDEASVQGIVDEMVAGGFDPGYRVLMPKDKRTARRIGYMVTTGVTHGMRGRGEAGRVRYWTYHHDDTRYGIVLASGAAGQDP